jgi:hypothetical protein
MSCWVYGFSLLSFLSDAAFSKATGIFDGTLTVKEAKEAVSTPLSFCVRNFDSADGWALDCSVGIDCAWPGDGLAATGITSGVCGVGVPALIKAIASEVILGVSESVSVLRFCSMGSQLLKEKLHFGTRVAGALAFHTPDDSALAGGIGVGLAKPKAIASRH